MSVVIETTLGDITVDLFLKERPRGCLNFIKLCRLKYYNFNLFHTIQQGFIAQTGDPSGTGNEGSSIWGIVEGTHKRFFEAETLPKIRHTEPGLLSMVSSGKNMIGSQFFFTLGADLLSLDGIHCVIGEIVEGHETLRKINEAICDDSSRPYQDIRITHTVVLEDPFDHPRGFKEPSRSPSPTTERLKNGRIAADEDIDDTEGKSEAQIQEMLAEREAKARATILEIVGDLPDADMAPPENVLFVCKLNPVTNDDDLEIIFSRFGKIKTCEVIRDKITGDSLQYAFVEFEDTKSCEDAYFKMDNVLIDDRRIHVDFSQSVAKIKWKGKGRIEYEDDSERGKALDFSKRNQDYKNPKRNQDYKNENRRSVIERSQNRNEKRDGYSREDKSYKDRRDDRRNYNDKNREYRESSNKYSDRNNMYKSENPDKSRYRENQKYSDSRLNDKEYQRTNDKFSTSDQDRDLGKRQKYSSPERKRQNSERTYDSERNSDKRQKYSSPERKRQNSERTYDSQRNSDKRQKYSSPERKRQNYESDRYGEKSSDYNRRCERTENRNHDDNFKKSRYEIEDTYQKSKQSKSEDIKRKKSSKKGKSSKHDKKSKIKDKKSKKKKSRRSSSSSQTSSSSSSGSDSSSSS